jgi:hypothetical protein
MGASLNFVGWAEAEPIVSSSIATGIVKRRQRSRRMRFLLLESG